MITINLTDIGIKAYNTYADMQADSVNHSDKFLLFVEDASADPDIDFPLGEIRLWATYRWDGVQHDLISAPFRQGGGGVLENDVPTNITVGGSDAYTTIPAGTTFDEYVKLVHQITFEPTLIAPSFNLTKSISTLQKVAANLTFDLIFNFNRGEIRGDMSGGVWNPNIVQNTRAGVATSYTIDSQLPQPTNVLNVTKIIALGINTYNGTVDYGVGPQPLDNTGANYSTPLPAGTSPVQSATVEGVYPIFASTSNITTATEQALLSMISANNIIKDLIGESGGNKQFFDVPDAWLSNRALSKVEFFNTVSGSFDTTNQLATFTTSAVTHTIEGNIVNYTRYTNNTSDRGVIKIRLNF